ncbi:MAG TPA: hypothetical protein GXX75_26855 [Clostridiales bacterium]|nr:hypothetical protein [Clostridiales bacterium]
MKQFSKLFIMVIMLVGMLLLTGCDKFNFSTFDASKEETDAGITKDADKDPDSSGEDTESTGAETKIGTNNEETKTPASSDNNTEKTGGSTPTPSLIQPTESIDLQIYTVNATTGDIEAVTASIPKSSKLTPELVTDTVVESMADQSIIIGIKDVTTKDDSIIVNFNKDNPPYKNFGSGYEGAILNAFAQSLLDNLKDYHKIIFRIDDKAYAGGAFEYGINEVYLEE